MTEKQFNLLIDSEWWIVQDNSIKSDKYRDDLIGDDAYRGLKEGELTEKEVVDLLNALNKENEQLKKDNTGLMKLLENQSIIIQKLHSKLLKYQMKEPIILTKKDLEIMGKAISYYTHGS